MFKISIKNLNLFGYHGVKESEKKDGQNFRFNIEISLKRGISLENDILQDTINYSEVIKILRDINNRQRFNLLETLSRTIADRIMKISPLVKKVSVKIEKTAPPIKENLGSVGVEYVLDREENDKNNSKRTGVDVYLSLGSNMGKRENNLRKAVDMIGESPNISIIEVSSIYETEPMYLKGQDYFYNIAIHCRADEKLGPFEFMGLVKGIEYKLGRRKADKRYSPRTIDIDLLYYGKMVIESDLLTVPHPKLKERKFVLVPLSEIAPGFKIDGKKIGVILKSPTLTGKVILIKSW
jgi:dihydroneopterin aldolase/2-amino-4-hydroxy-6-hydroxymethyldihydropteridine diphosphokinase